MSKQSRRDLYTGLYDLGLDLTGGPEGPDRSLLAFCLDDIREEQREGYFEEGSVAVEFGTGAGVTTEMIADVLPVISFDSFQGLPENWRPGFPAGTFSELEMREIPNATIVPGWFKDTVVGYDWPEKIALIHFDADLYSSTITCLASIGPHIKPGCILVFDEFHGYDDDFHGTMPGEQQAFRDYAEPWLEWFVIGHGREQWAIRIHKVSD